jgi:hypothetical protein
MDAPPYNNERGKPPDQILAVAVIDEEPPALRGRER